MSKVGDRNQRILTELIKLNGNSTCCDCGSRDTRSVKHFHFRPKVTFCFMLTSGTAGHRSISAAFYVYSVAPFSKFGSYLIELVELTLAVVVRLERRSPESSQWSLILGPRSKWKLWGPMEIFWWMRNTILIPHRIGKRFYTIPILEWKTEDSLG